MDNVLILGSGLSGVGACKLAVHQKMNVRISDVNNITKKSKNLFKKFNISWEEGEHSLSNLDWAKYIIKSPGISNKIDFLKEARKKKIPIISEIEFAFRYIKNKSKIIAITGSNGKTTTSKLIYYILKESGFEVEICGNSFSYSFSEKILDSPSQYYVLELSSFQLENIIDFQPDISVILNLSPDHLDRYDFDLNKYYDAKFHIQSNQKKDDFFIFFSDDKSINKRLHKCSEVTFMPFGNSVHVKKNIAWIDKKKIIINHKKKFTMVLHEMALQGRHNVYNSMAAGIATKILGVNNDILKQCLSDFKGIEHRLESVIKLDEKIFINDSKATNCNSVFFALESIKGPIVWICGGVDKGNDYSILNDLVRQKVDLILVIGEASEKIKSYFKKMVPSIIQAKSMEEAVLKANQLSVPGHTILLSPACSSFDMFQDYQERGRIFKECVFNL